jgi:hypothetical protein
MLCMLLSQKLVPAKIITHRIPIIGRGFFKGEGENGHTPRKNTRARYVVQMIPTYQVLSFGLKYVLKCNSLFLNG